MGYVMSLRQSSLVLFFTLWAAGNSLLAQAPLSLVRTGGKHPLFISLDLTIDRRPLSESRAEQFSQLFKLLDQDANSELSESEIVDLVERGPPAFPRPTDPNWWKSSDLSPADGKLSLEEFRSLEPIILGPQVQLQFLPPRQSQIFDLLGHLDVNKDGLASFEELQVGSSLLSKYDLNEDGSIAIEELVPPGTEGISPNGSAADRIWILVTPTNLAESALRIFKEYDRLPSGTPDEKLSAEELGLTSDELKAADADRDQSLNLAEFEKFLASPPPDLQSTLQIRTTTFRRPRLEIETTDPAIRLTRQDNSTLTLVDGIQVEWSSRGTMITADDARRFYRQRFIQADTDKNQYLTPEEFGTLQIPGVPFTLVDKDQDGKLFDKELLSYLVLQIALTRGRIVLICSNDTRSLLELLDRDSDRRLSAREFREVEAGLKNEDHNGDRAISAGELSQRQTVAMEYNRSPLLEFAARAANQTMLRSSTRQTLSGPLWFQKMDRNRDGYVTRREFLGPLDIFTRLDANRDQVIEETEAESQPQTSSP